MNVSACILILILIVVWLYPYQINKWNYDFCLCYRYCDTSALPGWGVTVMVSEQRLFPVENLKIVIKTCEEWMPPRRPPRRNTRTNHERNNTSSNETPVDPNIINAINQAVAGLLPNLVAQTAEAVIQQTHHPERTNTNPTSGGETRENTTNNITYSIDIWISKFQKQK
uniref:Uncharacterized protein n=1 Tax=Helianthus annuus TaxID=4232 RepID=A0A251TL93_HELAN